MLAEGSSAFRTDEASREAHQLPDTTRKTRPGAEMRNLLTEGLIPIHLETGSLRSWLGAFAKTYAELGVSTGKIL